MAAKKRGRDQDEWDDEHKDAVQLLQTSLERPTQQKLQALDKVIALVDPRDEQYTTQKALVAGDAAFYITELLADPAVVVRAAEAVAALCRHSAPALARLSAGPLVGLDSTVERVNLNPCQSDFVDSGAVAALVPMLLERQEAAREAATEAVAALCSYHQDGKLAYLEGLVQALQRQPQPQVLELLDALIDSMECSSEEAKQQLELLHAPLLAQLRPGGSSSGRAGIQAALSLAATLCERRSDAAGELREDGALASVTNHVLHGDQVLQDVAIRALWQLARGQRRCLSADGGQLGCDAMELAKVLIKLVEAADAEEARARQDFGAADSDSADGGSDGSPAAAAAACATPTAADICHAEEASQLLKALSSLYPDIKALVEEREVPLVRNTNCCIC